MIECFKTERRKQLSGWRKHWDSLPIARKEIYLVLSVIIGTVNFGLCINDLVQLGELRQPSRTTNKITTELLISSTFGFYLGLAGFVYSCIRKSRWKFVGIFSIVWNFIVVVLRMVIEIIYIDFRPESFGNE